MLLGKAVRSSDLSFDVVSARVLHGSIILRVIKQEVSDCLHDFQEERSYVKKAITACAVTELQLESETAIRPGDRAVDGMLFPAAICGHPGSGGGRCPRRRW